LRPDRIATQPRSRSTADSRAPSPLLLLLASSARRAARRTSAGRFVPLEEQDIGLWSPKLVAEPEEQLGLAARLGRFGPFQLMAAILSVHNRRALTVVRARALAPGHPHAAKLARRRAVELTTDPAVRAHLDRDGG